MQESLKFSNEKLFLHTDTVCWLEEAMLTKSLPPPSPNKGGSCCALVVYWCAAVQLCLLPIEICIFIRNRHHHRRRSHLFAITSTIPPEPSKNKLEDGKHKNQWKYLYTSSNNNKKRSFEIVNVFLLLPSCFALQLAVYNVANDATMTATG